jgi:hypothetical protein
MEERPGRPAGQLPRGPLWLPLLTSNSS